jgi:hypothetical protein
MLQFLLNMPSPCIIYTTCDFFRRYDKLLLPVKLECLLWNLWQTKLLSRILIFPELTCHFNLFGFNLWLPQVPGGPGDKHLEPGDVLVRVNGQVSLFDEKFHSLPKTINPLHFVLKKNPLHLFLFAGFSVRMLLYVSCGICFGYICFVWQN